jgi:hypothetical protein
MKKQIALAILSLAALNAFAATDEFTLTIRNHAFEPTELKVPAGKTRARLNLKANLWAVKKSFLAKQKSPLIWDRSSLDVTALLRNTTKPKLPHRALSSSNNSQIQRHVRRRHHCFS